jgi:predicted transcriptional regulator
MIRKRERLEIIHDILVAIKDKRETAKPTHILYKSNLSHQMLTEYMNELIGKEFIAEKVSKDGKKTYSLKQKGFDYLKDYESIRSFMESYGLDE